MAIVAKRTIMSMYTDADDVYSHQVRIVLAEKGVNADIIPTNPKELSEELLAINPYGTLPILIDRELVLYEARIIMEYLEERYPHPPLMPVYPVARAETRKMLHRIEHDWYRLFLCTLHSNNEQNQEADRAGEQFAESLLALEPLFLDKPYFLSEEFSLLDCALAPLLWRIPKAQIKLSSEALGIQSYMQRIFMRDSFQASLTDAERQLRVA